MNMYFKGCFALIMLIISTFQANCQSDLQLSHRININHDVLDTIEIKENSIMVSALWLNDTIKMTIQNQEIKIDTISLRKAKKDSTFLTESNNIAFCKQFIKGAGQNCYSYALEKYFLNNTTFSQDAFGEFTVIDRASVEKILTTYFEEVAEFLTKPKRNLKRPITNDVIVAFENESNLIIHTVYYTNGVFYSKNGCLKPSQFTSLRKFLKKSYWDTTKIIVYKIDEDKIKTWVN